MIKNLRNETDLSSLYFIYKGSTNLETKGTFGYSHYGEHLKCKCFDDLMDAFQENSISWNAYTSDNHVVFYFTGLEEYLAPFRDEIINRMYKPLETYVTNDDIIKEKKIVLEEYSEAFTSQDSIFYENLMRKKYNHYSPIGLREDLENITFESFKEVYKKQYEHPDMIINVSKTYVLDKTLTFQDRSNILKTDFNVENFQLEPNIDFGNNLCQYYIREFDKKDLTVVNLINKMLGTGLNSPLYQELREKRALCYGTSIFSHNIGIKNILFLTVNTTLDKQNIVHETLNNVLENKNTYITEERLQIIRKFISINRKKETINRHINIDHIFNDNRNIYDEIIDNIKLSEILEIYDKYYNLNNFELFTDKKY